MVGALLACSQSSPEQHLATAQQYIEQGKPEAAIIELKNALQQSPDNASIRFELGRLYLEERRYQEAEKELVRAMEYGYPTAEVVPLLSRSYQKTGADVALSKLENKYAGLSEDEAAEVSFYRLESHFNLQQVEKARALIEEIRNYQTDSPFKSLALVYGYLLDKNMEAAQLQLEEILAQHENQPDALELKARLHLMNGEKEQAIASYEQFHQAYPEDHQATFLLARLLTDAGRTEEAEPLVDNLLKINDTNPLLNQLKGLSRARDGDYKGALTYTEKALMNDGTDPAMRLTAGYAAYQLGKFEDARTHLSLVVGNLAPNHPALRLLAATELRLGMNEEAVDTLKRLEAPSPEDASLFSAAGMQMLQEGNLKGAKAMADRSEQVTSSPADLTRLGILQLSLNEIDGILKLEEALEKAPDEQVTRTTLASAYLATGQFDKALNLAQEWKEQQPDDVQGYLLAAGVYERQQKFDLAREQLEQAAKLAPEDAKVELAQIDLELLEGNLDKGRKELEAFLSDYPSNVAALARYFELQRQNGNAEKAIARIQTAFDKDAEQMPLRLLLANAYLVQNQTSKTVELLNKLPVSDQLPQKYWELLGQAYLRENRVEDAEKHYDTWVKRQPENAQALMGKMFLMDARNNFKEGLKLSESLVQRHPDDVRYLSIYTHFLLMSGNTEKARQQFDVLPAALKDSPAGQNLLGRLLASEGDCQAAMPLIETAYQRKPNNRNLNLALFCYGKTDQEEKGQALLVKHVEANPDDLAARMVLAQREIGQDANQAIAQYKQALELNESNYLALNNLAYLLMEQNQLAEARKYAERAKALRPEDPAVLDTLAQVLIAQKNFKEAETYLGRAANNQQATDEIYLNYVELLMKTGQKELAERKLKQREFKHPDSQPRIDKLKNQYGG
ncbi:XrtA/PEP-CTERM system TPR-repeat protein PrsT [Bowmanella dokdonensis]|uniref:XrtA/PEP-CTERM system TPR-repeat protein PrsT n=1 Tax=Bowmanella dokdonensis TaxID=751969 RepID=UPI002407E8B1|nr:XrtA/PEP-CTERM system TPR-repeat protein PrsT [Bowmanella dokdonensis]